MDNLPLDSFTFCRVGFSSPLSILLILRLLVLFKHECPYLGWHFAACFKATKACTRDYEIGDRAHASPTASAFLEAERVSRGREALKDEPSVRSRSANRSENLVDASGRRRLSDPR